MNRYFGLFFCLILWGNTVFAQSPLSPQEYLGYELGAAFTYHHRVLDYFQHVAEKSDKVQLIPYGKTQEGRDLMVAAVGKSSHINKLDDFRKANLSQTGLTTYGGTEKQLPIIWMSYNIHGNESVSTEVAMEVLYELITKDTANWLEEMIIIIDPCVNPDGRERYVNWFNQVRNEIPNSHPDAYEHHEPWPSGRFNHYMFDLNRDWCWQTQIESQQRAKIYQQWMPQVHVDFHEMSPNSSYYFGPAAKPYHEIITDWQRDFQQLVGKNHARYFDQNGWLYFTKETYDLLYPSYGDTWPIYQGAIGFTYEQGGSGSAGLSLKISSGDTLKLQDRFDHHFTTSLSTLETAYLHRKRLLSEFNQYFHTAQNEPVGQYKAFVIRGDNPPDKIRSLLTLLDRNNIQYAYPSDKTKSFKGYHFQEKSEGVFKLNKNDIILSSYQPQSHLLKVLFEPKTFLEDSITYDLTAWTLPYAYGLTTLASTTPIEINNQAVNILFEPQTELSQRPFAYLVRWEDALDVKFLASLLKAKIKVRFAELEFSVEKKTYPPGTLIISQADNVEATFDARLIALANRHQQPVIPIKTGFTEAGKDVGSGKIKFIRKPKIALIGGTGVSGTSFGAVWHYFEQEIGFPVTVIHTNQLKHTQLSKYHVILLASGSYAQFQNKLYRYVLSGGKIIALENAIRTFTTSPDTQNSSNTSSILSGGSQKSKIPETALSKAIVAKKKKDAKAEVNKSSGEASSKNLTRYENRDRVRISNSVAGSIYEVELDDSHPIAFGMGSTYYSLKRNPVAYPYLASKNWNIGTLQAENSINGFTGSKLRKKLTQSMAIGMEKYGKGQLIYFSDSPVFRGFWHNGKLLLGNAIFFTP